VFYAKYSTKFALWDLLLGMAYLPGGKKPGEFGLPYDQAAGKGMISAVKN
jgi:hypothetical protein